MVSSISAVKRLLATMPAGVHSRALATLFNHALRGQEVTGRFEEIEGKSVQLCITDIPCNLHFRFQRGRLRACGEGSGDVIIAGELAAFLRLAARDEDPDTLFFTRQLTIEGETETGLHIKNLLDSMEYDLNAHFDAVLPSPFSAMAKRISRRAEAPLLAIREKLLH